MQNFRRLRAWQSARHLTKRVYDITESFPPSERFGLTSQMRRAAMSIGANIAEGCGRGGPREFARFLGYASGSASELECHLQLATDVHLVDAATHETIAAEVSGVRRMIAGLMRSIRITGNG